MNGVKKWDCIEFYAKDVREVKIRLYKKHTSALGNKVEEECFTLKRGVPIVDKVPCANTTCTSCFSIRDVVVEAVLGRREIEEDMKCRGKEDPSRKKNWGEGCDTTLKLVVSPLFGIDG